MTPDELRCTVTYRILRDILVRHLQARREAILDRVDRQGWKWDSDLSRELTAVDEALTRVGAFDTEHR